LKIAIDGYYLAGRLRGMGRFAQMLVDGLPQEARMLLPSYPVSSTAKLLTRDQKWFPVWEQTALPRMARQAKADFLLCPYNTGPIWMSSPPVIVTIHDLIFLDNTIGRSPSAVQNLGRSYRRFVAPRIARSSSRIITCSEYSKSRIVSLFAIRHEKVVVIPNIVGDEWFQVPKQPISSTRYILAVAGEAPSKNTHRLIEAMALLHKTLPELILKIAGVNSRFHLTFLALAEKLGLKDHVQMLPYLDDSTLRATYAAAAAFVCPSLAEGFGIPLLEAMASGIPVSSSNTTSLPEVAGSCAVYFDPLDPDAMAAAMLITLDESAETGQRVIAARERAAQFTPSSVNARMQEFWKSLYREA
jgi:glycosyltransferase involved in cell wall biosynthesis